LLEKEIDLYGFKDAISFFYGGPKEVTLLAMSQIKYKRLIYIGDMPKDRFTAQSVGAEYYHIGGLNGNERWKALINEMNLC
ncbi:MAG: hypothetical protein ABIA63_02345, partial [bacterium]